MTKPLPYRCIKKKKNLPTLEELAVLLESYLTGQVGEVGAFIYSGY